MRAIALNCSLKPSAEASSTQRLLDEVLDALRSGGVENTEMVHAVDRNIGPGVTSNEGDGDAWPTIRQAILDADIVVLGNPDLVGSAVVGRQTGARTDGRLPR